MKTVSFFICFLFVFNFYAQVPSIEWQKCYGGTGLESASHMELTPDGGSIICGTTNSSDGDVNVSLGSWDGWVVKLDSDGSIEWETCLGGTGHDNSYYVINTTDGGFLVCCRVSSNDINVSGNHGGSDVWLVKLDNNGLIQWQKCYGGSGYEMGWMIKQTSDGGYIFCGDTDSNDGDVIGHLSDHDVWIVKLNATGNIVWQKCYGGNYSDHGVSVDQTSDGGYIIGAYTSSTNGNITGFHGGYGFDGWVLKLDLNGNLQWQKCYGGTSFDYIRDVKQSNDGGYLIIGKSQSSDGDITNNHGAEDAWVIKTNSIGNIVWEQNYGGTNDDFIGRFSELANGDIIILGTTKSNDIDISLNHGQSDAWFFRISQTGLLLWEKCFGGTSYEQGITFTPITDGYLFYGSASSNDGDVSGNNEGSDLWLIKLSEPAGLNNKSKCEVVAYPNPTVDFFTIKVNKSLVNNRYIISDEIGKIIKEGVLSFEINTIDIHTLENGLYYLHVGEELNTIKISKH